MRCPGVMFLANTPMPSQTKVLVVDDNDIHLYAIERRLAAIGFVVKTVNCGSDAVNETLRGSYDALLLDVHLPDLNGYQTCQIIRSDHHILQPAIIFHSATDPSENSARRAHEAGGDAFLTYPIADTELAAVLLGSVAMRRLLATQSGFIDAVPMTLPAGSVVPISGIYLVHHANGHRNDGPVCLFQGAVLPECTQCVVSYTLQKAAPHVTEDPDFSQNLD